MWCPYRGCEYWEYNTHGGCNYRAEEDGDNKCKWLKDWYKALRHDYEE